MTRETQLGELLMQWEERRQQGKAVAVEDLCRETPELIEELHRRIHALEALGPVLAVTPSTDISTIPYDERANDGSYELLEIPGYEVLSELGRTRMSVVYKVRNLSLERSEALKMGLAIQRFRVEIRATARFEHHGIVRIYASGEQQGRPFFTMEFFQGGTLNDHLKRFQNDPRASVALMAKVARAVHFLHQKGIVHRDLKPSNILLKDQDEPVVSDFGLAKVVHQEDEAGPELEGSDPNLTRPGAIMGTSYYMSPEQAGGKRITETSDFWALGVILYELLTGRRPFLGKNNEEVRQAILKGERKTPRELKPKIDRHLEAICLKCLGNDPNQRYSTAEALAKDLENWRPPGLWPTVRRHPTISAAMILLTVFAVLLCGIALAFWPSSPAPQDPIEFVQGMPIRWPLGEAKLDWQGDRMLQLESDKLRLQEVFDKAPWERYQFQAEVQDTSPNSGAIGIYVARSQQATEKGMEHWLRVLSYAEEGRVPRRDPKLPKLGEALFTLQGLREPNSQHVFTLDRNQKMFDWERPKWRKLTLEVTSELVQAFWGQDAEPFCHGARPNLVNIVQKQLNAFPQAPLRSPPNFSFGGGMGLYCLNGAGLFKNLVVTPLPEKR